VIKGSTAVFAVADVNSSVEFYCNVLGFRQNWLWGNPPTFASVGFAKTEIFLCQQPDLATRVEGHMHCFFIEGSVDELHAQHVASGASIIAPPENKPWGLREYVVRDPSGYHLRFGGRLTYERPATALDLMPAHVRVEIASLTLAEYVSLFESVSWYVDRPAMETALRNSHLVVVARDQSRGSEAVGMVRVAGDGKYLTIWDVIVRPSHQAMKIGSAMMERTLAELRKTAPPRTFVGLFTPKPEFYERFGFQTGGGMHLSL
jgi:catechol 2,3-dioxygenase-like lactoylglutathione lyase family enzyme